MEKQNPFEKAEQDSAKQNDAVTNVPQKDDNSKSAGRKLINEDTIQDMNWLKVPGEDEKGSKTETLKIKEFYQQPGRDAKTKDGEVFYTGMTGKNGERLDEFIVEGTVNGVASSVRLASWELVYKMMTLVSYCKSNNFTVSNQTIELERINAGRKNAGNNWILHVPSLKIQIGKDNEVSQSN